MENLTSKKDFGNNSKIKVPMISVKVAKDGEDNTEENVISIAASLDTYLEDIGRIAYAYPITMAAMNAGSSKSLDDLVKILNKYSVKSFHKAAKGEKSNKNYANGDSEPLEKNTNQKSDGRFVSVDFHLDIPEGEEKAFYRDTKRISRSMGARELVSRSFISALVSQYDAYIGNLLRAILNCAQRY